MPKVLMWNGNAGVFRIYFAPGIISSDAIHKLREKFEEVLLNVSEKEDAVVVFKGIVKARDYYAIIGIETNSYEKAYFLASSIEKKMKIFGSRTKRSIYSEISSIK